MQLSSPPSLPSPRGVTQHCASCGSRVISRHFFLCLYRALQVSSSSRQTNSAPLEGYAAAMGVQLLDSQYSLHINGFHRWASLPASPAVAKTESLGIPLGDDNHIPCVRDSDRMTSQSVIDLNTRPNNAPCTQRGNVTPQRSKRSEEIKENDKKEISASEVTFQCLPHRAPPRSGKG